MEVGGAGAEGQGDARYESSRIYSRCVAGVADAGINMVVYVPESFEGVVDIENGEGDEEDGGGGCGSGGQAGTTLLQHRTQVCGGKEELGSRCKSRRMNVGLKVYATKSVPWFRQLKGFFRTTSAKAAAAAAAAAAGSAMYRRVVGLALHEGYV